MTSQRKIFLKNFIWNMLGTGFNSFNSLFFLVIVTRINGIQDAGIFSIAWATAYILYTIGLYSGRLCQVTDTENKIKDKDYIASRIITSVIMIILAILFVIIKQYTAYKSSIFLLLCCYKATEAMSEILYGIMQKNEFLYKVGQSLTIKSIGGLLLFLSIDAITHNLILACSSMILLNILVMYFFDFQRNCRNLIDFGTKVNRTHVHQIFKSEFFVFANSLIGIYVLNASKYAIDNYLTEDIQAIFGYIMMPATIINLFTQLIFMPYLTKLKEFYEQKKIKELKKIAFQIKMAVIGFGILATTLGFLIGPEVLSFIYGENLMAYRMNLSVILATYILYGISYINLILLTTTRDTFIQFVIYLATAIVAYFVSNAMVKTMQINGATISCAITLGIQFLLYAICTRIVFYKIEQTNLK